MGADARAPGMAEVGARVPERSGELTRRASLNAAAALLDYAVRIVVGLAVTPVLVRGLGYTLFGVWEMLVRLGGYLSATDGRPTEALRLVIAQRQASPDDAAKRRCVGAALAVWLLALPLVAGVGGLLVWVAPRLTSLPAALTGDVRFTVGLLVVSFTLSTLAAVPESVLRGMNLGFKRMGAQAGVSVLGGALSVAAVATGLGLVGLGGATALRAAAGGVCFWLLVRGCVSWFGAARPSWGEIRGLFGISAWLSAGDIIAKILLASDVVILGMVVAPAVVTTYVLTGYAARTAVGVHVLAAGAAVPGLGGVLGRGELQRAAETRRDLLTLTWLFATVVGATILLWNRAFLALWVGPVHYAGLWVNLLIVLAAVQTAFIRVDASVIDAALRPRERVLVGAAAAVLTIAASVLLSRALGLVGLCAGMLLGRAVQSVAYPLLARRSLGRWRGPAAGVEPVRLVGTTALIFAGAASLGDALLVSAWPVWALGVGATLPALTGLTLLLGPTVETRERLLERARALRRGGWPRWR